MRADIHVLGSSDGYKTISRSSGLSPHEEGELTVLNFGQAESSDMESLRVSPTIHGRVLPGGRYALTKYVPAGVDDVGRPTIDLRTLVMDVSVFDQCVRGRLAQFINDDSIWSAPEFESGLQVNLPPKCALLPPIPSDYSLLDAATANKGGNSMAMVQGEQAGSDALVHMIGAIDSSEVAGLSWGIGLLSTGVDASIATLMVGRRPDGRRLIRSYALNSDITSLAIKSSLQDGRAPSSVMQAPASAVSAATSGGWVQSSGSSYGLSQNAADSERSDDWDTGVGVAGAGSPSSKSGAFPTTFLAGAVAFLFLVLGGFLAITLLGSNPGVKKLQEYQGQRAGNESKWDASSELAALQELQGVLDERGIQFGIDEGEPLCDQGKWGAESLDALGKRLDKAIAQCVSGASDDLASAVDDVTCLVDAIERRLRHFSPQSEYLDSLKVTDGDHPVRTAPFWEAYPSPEIKLDEELPFARIQMAYAESLQPLKQDFNTATSLSAIDAMFIEYVQLVGNLHATHEKILELKEPVLRLRQRYLGDSSERTFTPEKIDGLLEELRRSGRPDEIDAYLAVRSKIEQWKNENTIESYKSLRSMMQARLVKMAEQKRAEQAERERERREREQREREKREREKREREHREREQRKPAEREQEEAAKSTQNACDAPIGDEYLKEFRSVLGDIKESWKVGGSPADCSEQADRLDVIAKDSSDDCDPIGDKTYREFVFSLDEEGTPTYGEVRAFSEVLRRLADQPGGVQDQTQGQDQEQVCSMITKLSGDLNSLASDLILVKDHLESFSGQIKDWQVQVDRLYTSGEPPSLLVFMNKMFLVKPRESEKSKIDKSKKSKLKAAITIEIQSAGTLLLESQTKISEAFAKLKGLSINFGASDLDCSDALAAFFQEPDLKEFEKKGNVSSPQCNGDFFELLEIDTRFKEVEFKEVFSQQKAPFKNLEILKDKLKKFSATAKARFLEDWRKVVTNMKRLCEALSE